MRMRNLSSLSALIFLCSASAVSARAQDTRRVTEPHIPSACVTLEADIAAAQGIISPKDERAPDTEHIQRAIDACTAGEAVVLRAHGRRNVFLTGPITLRAGVTLVVDANTALVASR